MAAFQICSVFFCGADALEWIILVKNFNAIIFKLRQTNIYEWKGYHKNDASEMFIGQRAYWIKWQKIKLIERQQ